MFAPSHLTTPLRLALFIDAQNTYRRAGDRFFPNTQFGVDGQFDPVRLGQLIARQGKTWRRILLPIRSAYLLRSACSEIMVVDARLSYRAIFGYYF